MIQDKIEQAEQFCEGERGAEFTGHLFPPGELLSLLREVAREQREICASHACIEIAGADDYGVDFHLDDDSILNAPSPLNEDSHE